MACAAEDEGIGARLASERDLDMALEALVVLDPRLAPLLAAVPAVPLRRVEPGIAGLVRIVGGQQISTYAAAAIHGRLEAALGRIDGAGLASLDAAALAAVGYSRPKIRTLLALGAAHRAGLDLEALGRGDPLALEAALDALPGIGPWTIAVYRLFALGHADAFPAGDLALQEAARAGLGLAARPPARAFLELAELWRPHRGAAALLLWAFYRTLSGRQGAVA